jgi:hypothetical protein
MMGTSNHEDIIPDDSTGNTRFAVIRLHERQDFGWLNAWRKQIIAEARVLAEKGYEPQVDWKEVTAAHTEQSAISAKFEEFLDLLREGAKGILLVEGRKAKYWKGEVFWTFYNNGIPYRPAMWEMKEMAHRAKAAGLGFHVSHESAIDRTRDGRTIKNVYKLPPRD